MPFHVSPIEVISSLIGPSRLSYHFNFDVASGVAVFIGGRSAVSALALRPLCGQPWHGWCNTPGCHAIIWELFRALFQTSVSPDYSERLGMSLGMCGRKGPRYIASRSGTVMPRTGHLADVLVNGNWTGKEYDVKVVGQRGSPTPTKVTIIDFKKGVPKGDETLQPGNSRNSSITRIPTVISTVTSVAAYLFCAYYVEDQLASMMTMLGILCSGVVSVILGTGKITLLDARLKPAKGVPPGDGMLLSDNHIVVLRGNEEDVNAVTKGRLRLSLRGGSYTLLLCVFIMSLQVAAQLVFMPFASVQGQLVFLLSLLVSGVCNLYLSTKEDDVRSNALISLLNTPEIKTYQARSRASASVLACLALCWESNTPPEDILRELVPIKPRPWEAWSACLAQNIRGKNREFLYGREYLSPTLASQKSPESNPQPYLSPNDKQEKECLQDLIDDAHAAYVQYIVDYNIPCRVYT